MTSTRRLPSISATARSQRCGKPETADRGTVRLGDGCITAEPAAAAAPAKSPIAAQCPRRQLHHGRVPPRR
jgi:hypothetical protein